MDEMECGNCGYISLPRQYYTEDKKYEAWECVEAKGGCGVITWPENWIEVEEEDEDGVDSES